MSDHVGFRVQGLYTWVVHLRLRRSKHKVHGLAFRTYHNRGSLGWTLGPESLGLRAGTFFLCAELSCSEPYGHRIFQVWNLEEV